MRVLILSGSPHVNGTTSYLVENYAAGLKETGHSVTIIDVAKMNINTCIACDHCRRNNGVCVHKDDMEKIYPLLMDSDRVVLATPLYYFGMTSHLKTVIDRFYSINPKLRETTREFDLLAVCGDKDSWAMDALIAHYEAIGKYLNWRCLTPLLAYGFYTRKEIENSDYGEKAKMKAKGC